MNVSVSRTPSMAARSSDSRQHQVGDLRQAAHGLGGLPEGTPVDRDRHHRHGLVAQRHRVGDGHHLHHPGRLEAGDPLAHGRLGEAELTGDGGERAAPVALQGGHDAPVDRIHPRPPGHAKYLPNSLTMPRISQYSTAVSTQGEGPLVRQERDQA
jgi:hypothetical protein